MTKEKPKAEHAIIVTFDTGAHAPPAIALAAALARARQQELHGLFIEDEDLLKAARLPFAREIHRASGRPLEMSDARLERALARLREEFRAALELHARQQSLDWSYSSMRGSRSRLAQPESPRADILVISAPVAARPKGERILLLDSTHTGTLKALASILDTRETPVEVLVSDSQPDEALLALLAERPGAGLRKLGPIAPEILFKDPDLRPALVLAARDCPAPRLQRCLRLARCPVLLVA